MNAHVKARPKPAPLAPNKADIIDHTLCSVPGRIRDSIPRCVDEDSLQRSRDGYVNAQSLS